MKAMTEPPLASVQKVVPVTVRVKLPAAPAVRLFGVKPVIAGGTLCAKATVENKITNEADARKNLGVGASADRLVTGISPLGSNGHFGCWLARGRRERSRMKLHGHQLGYAWFLHGNTVHGLRRFHGFLGMRDQNKLSFERHFL